MRIELRSNPVISSPVPRAGFVRALAALALATSASAEPARTAAQAAASAVGAGALPATSACAWSDAAPAPQPRGESPACVIDGKLYVFGGFFNSSLQVSQRVDVYDPTLDAWSSATDIPLLITHTGLAVDGTTVWLAGGFAGNHPGAAVADVRLFDTTTGAWASGPPLPEPRAGGALVRLERALHYFGGVLADRNTDSGSHWVLDLDQPGAGWSARAPLPDPRNHLSGAVVGPTIYAIGGQHEHDVNPQDVASVHAYDTVADAWSAVASLPFARSHCEPGTSVHAGRILVAGGRGPTPGALSIGEVVEYDPLADAWSTGFVLPMPLFAPVAHPIGDEYVVTCGGPSVQQPQATTWRRSLSAAPPSERRIDAGSLVGSVQSGSTAWCPDDGFLGGQAFAIATNIPIASTDDDALYRSERSGSNAEPTRFGYSFAAVPGWYRVRLHFAEIYWGAPGGGPGGIGKRVFDVRLEGATVLDDYDVTAAVGALAASVETFELAVGDGAVDLELESSVDRPTIAAIEVVELSAGSIAGYCTTSPNSAGPGATIGWQGSSSLTVDDLVLTVAGGPADKTGLFFFGSAADATPFGDGIRCVAGQVFRLATVTLDANGAASTELDFSTAPENVIAPGSTWHFQLRYRDPFGPGGSGFNFSDALVATFWP